MKNSTLNEYLLKGRITALERGLCLEEFLGFADGHFEFSELDWSDEPNGQTALEQYRKFVGIAWSYSSLVGVVFKGQQFLKHTTTIVFYDEFYRVQVESCNTKEEAKYYNSGVFEEYVDALTFAYSVVKGED
jgi:hypothetical protein